MDDETFKVLDKIASTLNTKVHVRILNFLQENDQETMCIAEICRECGLNKYRGYHYFKSLGDIGVIHLVTDGSKSLVFLDKDRLKIYTSTAKYLEANMEPRTKKRDAKLYG